MMKQEQDVSHIVSPFRASDRVWHFRGRQKRRLIIRGLQTSQGYLTVADSPAHQCLPHGDFYQ